MKKEIALGIFPISSKRFNIWLSEPVSSRLGWYKQGLTVYRSQIDALRVALNTAVLIGPRKA